MNFSFSNSNTLHIQQKDGYGTDRAFNYGVGKEFVPLNTNLMIAAKITGPMAVNGRHYTYIGVSDVITAEQLKTICAFSDQQALTKKLSKLSSRKRKRLLSQIKESAAETYYLGVSLFLDWLVANDLHQHITELMDYKWKAEHRTPTLGRDLAGMKRAMGFDKDGGISPKKLAVNSLCPVKNYEKMSDAKLMWFINNNEKDQPEILAVVYSEKENYYALDDIGWYDFAQHPDTITSAVHPKLATEQQMFNDYLKRELKGKLIKVPSMKDKDNGSQIHIVLDVMEHSNGYVEVEAFHQDNIPIEVTYNGVKGNKNKYCWWVRLSDDVPSTTGLEFVKLNKTKPMTIAAIKSMKNSEMMRMGTFIVALTGQKHLAKSTHKGKIPSFSK